MTATACRIGVNSLRLREFVRNTPVLNAELVEAREQLADTAEEVVREALYDKEDAGRRDAMAKFVLSNVGRKRGYGTQNSSVNIKTTGTVVIGWADGTEIAIDDSVS